MTSLISFENNENAHGEQPSGLPQQNSDDTQSKMSNSGCPENNVAELIQEIRDGSQEEATNAVNLGKDENTLIEKVNKLDLSFMKTGEISESENTAGTVVQNKLSESLSYLQDYNSGEDDDGDTSESDDAAMQGLQFRDLEDVSEDSDADSETEDYDSMDDLYGDGTSGPNSKISKKEEEAEAPWISDLGVNESTLKVPDISTLELNNKEEFLHIGNIDCVLDKFVTIEGLPAMPAYDLDTLFFVEEGRRVLGYVFDVMGPVSSPIYVVHMETVEAVQNLQLKRGTKIYCAPKSKYTKYVFLHELMKIRGSDASWMGDTEVPIELAEFSDDEEERQKKALKNKASKRKHGSLERHQQFEANMNKINQLNSRLHNMVDSRNPLRQRIQDQKVKNDRSKSSTNSALPGIPPHWLTQPPPPPEQDIPQMPFDGSQSLETYFQNCTSQFLQHWRPHLVNPPVPAPQQFYSQQFYTPPPLSHPAPVFDPSTPPPTYRGPNPSLPRPDCYYSGAVSDAPFRGGPPVPPYGNFSSSHTNPVGRHRSRNNPNFRQNNRPGPSNGN